MKSKNFIILAILMMFGISKNCFGFKNHFKNLTDEPIFIQAIFETFICTEDTHVFQPNEERDFGGGFCVLKQINVNSLDNKRKATWNGSEGRATNATVRKNGNQLSIYVQ